MNFWHSISFLFTAKLQRVLQPDEQQEQEEGGGEEGGGGEGGEGEGGRGYKVMAFKRKTEWTIESILRIQFLKCFVTHQNIFNSSTNNRFVLKIL